MNNDEFTVIYFFCLFQAFLKMKLVDPVLNVLFTVMCATGEEDEEDEDADEEDLETYKPAQYAPQVHYIPPHYISLFPKLFYLLAQKPDLEKMCIYSSKFFHNFHLSESSFTCPGLWGSGLVQRLYMFYLLLCISQIIGGN
jgi:hypothetical protein